MSVITGATFTPYFTLYIIVIIINSYYLFTMDTHYYATVADRVSATGSSAVIITI
jgi:hypothetical protein